jgi:two-component system LytT family sensor kinase
MKKWIVVLLHFGYWVLYLFLLYFLLFTLEPAYGRELLHFWYFTSFGIVTIGPALLTFYISYFVLFPWLLLRKRIFLLILLGLLIAFISTVLVAFLLSIFADRERIWASGWDGVIALTIAITSLSIIHGVIALVIKGFISWYNDIKLKDDLNKKNFEMELALVKSQINPHFLFNTLNNIDVLIAKDAAKASAYLNKLSDIMRFMLYETKTEKIPLTKELDYIEKYIELQKIRTSNPNYVNFVIEGNPDNLRIAPMLFIPFIENAFKHAKNKKIEQAIVIKISIEKDQIVFECENNYSEDSQVKDSQNGLGNKLIQKRLNLLYPEKHILQVKKENNTYKVKLLIKTIEN